MAVWRGDPPASCASPLPLTLVPSAAASGAIVCPLSRRCFARQVVLKGFGAWRKLRGAHLDGACAGATTPLARWAGGTARCRSA